MYGDDCRYNKSGEKLVVLTWNLVLQNISRCLADLFGRFSVFSAHEAEAWISAGIRSFAFDAHTCFLTTPSSVSTMSCFGAFRLGS